MDSSMNITEIEELGLDEGDWIIHLPTNQVGLINRIFGEELDILYELKIQTPDKRVICHREDIKLIIPNG
jgi:hypothetical protein